MRPRRLSATTTVLVLLCLMYGITYIDRVNVSTAASAFQRELLLNNTQVGLVFSAFAYPYLIFQIIGGWVRSEEHTSELQSQSNLVCRLLLEKKKKKNIRTQKLTPPPSIQ